MDVNTTFDFYGYFDVSEFKNIIENTEMNWSEWKFSRELFPTPREIKGIHVTIDPIWLRLGISPLAIDLTGW